MPVTVYQPILFGDTDGSMGGMRHGVGQNISIHLPGISDTQSIVGDAGTLLLRAVGGNDDLTSFAYSGTTVIGDAITISGQARGGNDHILATSMTNSTALGDAMTLNGHAQGGNDNVDARGGTAAAYGDAYEITDRAVGGNDVVTGAGFPLSVTQLYGDAQILSRFAVGGDDTLIAAVSGTAAVTTAMYGDGAELRDHARGGNDTLISATSGNDQMWGDAAVVAPSAQTGADTFVFAPSNGHDQIMDFEPGKDHVQLNGFGFAGFADLAIQYTLGGAVVTFDASDSILLAGINHLSASDFILA